MALRPDEITEGKNIEKKRGFKHGTQEKELMKEWSKKQEKPGGSRAKGTKKRERFKRKWLITKCHSETQD